jgi:hypothetical protein
MRKIQFTAIMKFDSIEIDESGSQSEKQEEPRRSTVRGMTIEEREDQEKADDPIRRNNEPDSIPTDENDLQSRKRLELTVSTVRGMTMDEKEEQINVLDRIARTKRSAPIRTITWRRLTHPLDSDLNPLAISPQSININPTTAIATTGRSDTGRCVPAASVKRSEIFVKRSTTETSVASRPS